MQQFRPTTTFAFPRSCTADGFALEASRAAGIDLSALDPITVLVVQTDNSVYRIAVSNPAEGDVFVQGGPVFPEVTSASLSGASLGGSWLKPGRVVVGLHMEFHWQGKRVVTSRVRSIAIAPPGTARPM